MKSAVSTLALLAALIVQVSSLQDFSAYQVSVYDSTNDISISNSPYFFTTPHPQGYDPATHKMTLALSGYSFTTTGAIAFQAYLDSVTTNITIVLDAKYFFRMGLMRFSLIFVNQTSEWIWIMNGSYLMMNLSTYSNGIYEERIAVPGVPNVIFNEADFRSTYSLISFKVNSIGGNSVKFAFAVDTIHAPNDVQAIFTRGTDQSKISWASYSVTLINVTRMLAYNIPFHGQTLAFYTTPANLGPEYLPENSPVNLNIPDMFINPALGTFQGKCMLNIFRMAIGGNIPTSETRTVLFDLLTYPITATSSIPTTNYGGEKIYYEDFFLQIFALCFTVCPSGQTFNLGLSICTTCPQYCAQCLTVSSCTECIDTYYLNTTTNQCLPCSSVLQNCSTCANQTYCLTCADQKEGFDPVSGTCLLCSNLFEGCLTCTNDGCTSCFIGYLVNHRCTSIPGCSSSVTLSSGEQVCFSCDSSRFDPEPFFGVCQCYGSATLISGICNNISGCLLPIMEDDQTETCKFCNMTANLNATPATDGSCVCADKYEFDQYGVCVDVCGDGYLMTVTDSACDDGNLIDGDGCSSSCEVETFYNCENGTKTSPSSCVYRGVALTLSLKKIERTEGMNQGIFQFAIEPPLININKMNLSEVVDFSCQQTYTIGDISYSAGVLQIVADYTEDMEGRQCNLTLTYNATVIVSPESAFQFEAISRNMPLIISTALKFYEQFKIIFKALSYIVLGVFIVSLGHKMIGAELMTCCQMVYLSHCFYSTPSFLLNSIKSFDLVTGLWFLFYTESDRELLFPFTDRVQLSAFFIKSSLVVVSILLMSVFIWLFFFVFSILTRKDNLQTESPKDPSTFAQNAPTNIYKVFLFPITASFLIVLQVSAYVSCRRLSQQSQEFLFKLNSFWLLFAVGMIAMIVFTEISSNQFYRHIRGEKHVKWWYIPLFLFRSLALSLFIEAGIPLSLSKTLYAVVGIELLYLVFVLVKRPYKSVLHSLGMLFCEFTILYSLSLAVIRSFYIPQEEYEVFLIFVLEGMIIIVLCFSILRVGKVVWEFVQKCRRRGVQKVLKQKKEKKQLRVKSQKSQEEEEQRQLLSKLKAERQHKGYFQVKKEKVSSDATPLSHHLNLKQVQGLEDENLMLIKERLRENLLIRKKNKKKVEVQP